MSEPLVIERHVAAPPSRVWSLWTTADGLAEWWWDFLADTTYAVDLRVGGDYRIASAGAGFGVHGTFEVVEHERRIGATWIWIDGDDDGDVEHIEVTFAVDGAGTRVRIVHDGPWETSEPAAAYLRGWTDTLARLEALVG